MIIEKKIVELVEEKISGTNNFIVEVSVKPTNKITILLDNDSGLSIKDCVQVSRHVESNLNREEEDFELQVSSPGLDQPLKTLRQYIKYIGKQVEVLTTEGRKIIGKLNMVNNSEIELEEKNVPRKKRALKTIGEQTNKQIITNNIRLTFDKIKETKIIISF